MPKSKVRKKSVYTPPQGTLQSGTAAARAVQPSPRWYAPLMVSLGAWNFAIGFGAMVAGLVMSMRWR